MLHRVLYRAASHVDRAAYLAMAASGGRAKRIEHLDRIRTLQQIRAVYDRPEHLTAPETFFCDPAPIGLWTSHVRPMRWGGGAGASAGRSGLGAVVDVYWQSAFAPYCRDIAASYLANEANKTAAARLFLHRDSPRPAVLLLHGYRCGQWPIEELVWPVSWLFERGLDVALPVLPFHAVRAARGRRPIFPSRHDPRVTIEGFRQAIFDLRALMNHLESRGAPAFGVLGMSLGGYTTSLLATLDPRLAFAVPMVPLASIADFTRASGDLVGTDEELRLQHEALDAVFRVVCPLARPARVDRDRILVIGATNDRITPVAHARKLAEHFGAPLEIFPGGHVLQLGRAAAFRSVGRMLARLGLIDAPCRG